MMWKHFDDIAQLSIRLIPFIGVNNYGEKIYDQPKEVRGYLTHTSKSVTTDEGEVITSTMQLFLPPSESIKVGDMIVFQGQSYVVKEVSYYFDELGDLAYSIAYL